MPLGYEVKDRKLVINKAEAEKVRWIFERFTTCRSARLIVRELAAKGFANRYGHKLDKGRIYKILNNGVYIGDAVHKGQAYIRVSTKPSSPRSSGRGCRTFLARAHESAPTPPKPRRLLF